MSAAGTGPGGPGTEGAEPSLLSSSAVMAAGTVVSRLSGYVRSTLLVAALGTGLHADVFNIANTIPNMLYILLAGGVVNAVFVPQLVRAMRHDPDGGEAFTNRVITLAAIFLLGATIVLVAAAPLLMRLFLDRNFFTPELAPQRDAAINFARYCLPQVFFYGMFVLVGQVLNARRSFGPMMWAPIANNVISVLVLVAYLVTIGTAHGSQKCGGYSSGAELLLGLGSTVGIAVQLLVLVPYLRAAGIRYRPRFDFRHSGLGHTLRLGVWTVLFVVANQLAYTVVVHIASSGTVRAGLDSCSAGGTAGTGYTIYSGAFLLAMVPHSIITVSLATAMLPSLSTHAADGNLGALGRSVANTLRSAYAVLVPLFALLPVVALEAADLVFGWGAGATSYRHYVPTLSLFALGLFFFSGHYLVLRGFYSLEQTRRVFWIQCVVAVTNIVAAIALTRGTPASQTAPRLVVAYALAYAVGAVLSYTQLARQVGGLGTRRTVRFGVRVLLAVAVATAVAAVARWGMLSFLGPGKASTVLVIAVVGLLDLTVYLVLARALRIVEVTEVTRLLTRRLRRR